MIYPLYVAAPPKHPFVEFHSLKREQLAEEISFPIGKTLSASMIPHRPSWLNKRPPPAVTTGGGLLFQGFDEVSSQCFALGDFRMLEAQREPVAEFDERLWGAMVDYVTVGVDRRLTMMFRDGTTIQI